jgi:hypothetical protein
MAELPPDGSFVEAMTYVSSEYDRESERVTGTLYIRPSPLGGRQCWVAEEPVIEATVRLLPGLPPDGSPVEAMTYASLEYYRDPEKVTGVLSTRLSPFGYPPQCWVNGVQVDPATVRLSGKPAPINKLPSAK